MANPLNSLLQPSNPVSSVSPNTPNPGIACFQRMVKTLNAAKNPSAALNLMAQQNPQLQQVMQLCRGKDPKAVFIQACQSRGIDANELIQKLGLQ